MNITTKAIGFTLAEDEQALVAKKLEKVRYAEDLIVDLSLVIKEDKKFIFEATVNFRWGASAHVTGEDYKFAAGLDKLMDVLEGKIRKEKDKMQDKK
jgi:putative sigma-54 modulation protein